MQPTGARTRSITIISPGGPLQPTPRERQFRILCYSKYPLEIGIFLPAACFPTRRDLNFPNRPLFRYLAYKYSRKPLYNGSMKKGTQALPKKKSERARFNTTSRSVNPSTHTHPSHIMNQQSTLLYNEPFAPVRQQA